MSNFDIDKSNNGFILDTNISYLDTIENKKILIRELAQLNGNEKNKRVCLQIGIYSPGRFNYLCTKTNSQRCNQIRKELRKIALSLKHAPFWTKQYNF